MLREVYLSVESRMGKVKTAPIARTPGDGSEGGGFIEKCSIAATNRIHRPTC